MHALEIVLLLISTLIYAPLGILGTVTLWKYRQLILFRKRHVIITITNCILLLSHLLIYCITVVLVNIVNDDNNFGTCENDICQVLFRFSYLKPCVIFGSLYSFLARFWLLYFDINWIKLQSNQEWQCLINSNLKQWQETNRTLTFFIKHKKTLGNYEYVKKLCIKLWIITSIVSTLLWICVLSNNFSVFCFYFPPRSVSRLFF